MPYQSNNHNYDIPKDNESGWGDTLQATLEALDDDVIIKDTKTNRPAGPDSDTWFLATDEPTLYHYNGTSWQTVAGVGTSTEPLAGTAYREAVQTENLSAYRGDRPWASERRSWRHRRLPLGQNWNRFGTDKPIITPEMMPDPYDDFVADAHLFGLDGRTYLAFEVKGQSAGGDTWIAELDVSYNPDSTISSVSVDLIEDGNPAINPPSHQSFPFMDRVGDIVYITASGGETAGVPHLYKCSISDFRNHNFASGFSHVRPLVEPTGNTGPDGDWNADFHADPAWVTRNGYHFLFVSTGRTSDHVILGIWHTDDRENGEMVLHPDSPLDFEMSNNTTATFPLDLGNHLVLWDQRVDYRQVSELTTDGIDIGPAKPALRSAGLNQEQGSVHSLSVARDGPAWLGIYDALDSNNTWQIFAASQPVN